MLLLLLLLCTAAIDQRLLKPSLGGVIIVHQRCRFCRPPLQIVFSDREPQIIERYSRQHTPVLNFLSSPCERKE